MYLGCLSFAIFIQKTIFLYFCISVFCISALYFIHCICYCNNMHSCSCGASFTLWSPSFIIFYSGNYTYSQPNNISLTISWLIQLLWQSRRDGPSPLGCCCCYYYRCYLVMLLLSLLSGVVRSCSCRSCACCYRCYIRSNNYCVDTILWVILFQTTQFLYPRIYHSSPAMKSHPTTRFYCPPQSKSVVFIPKITLFTDFRPFFARKTVKYEPILKWFSFSNSSRQALQHCLRKVCRDSNFVAWKIIIETFKGDNRFACVSSVVFKAKSIWISRNVLARQSEQFDTTHDFLGRKLTKLENCIFRLAKDRFRKRRLF